MSHSPNSNERKNAFYWDENVHAAHDLRGKRQISNTFWGKAWCNHLESYSDFANRLPRGRTYARTGRVEGLVITPGTIRAKVLGSNFNLYRVAISISNLARPDWDQIKKQCAGQIDSAIDLLQGKISKSILEIITSKKTGLFPSPRQIKMSCTCPDAADFCKHSAAVLYRFGNILDTNPELLFLIRQVDHQELITAASASIEFTSGDTYLDANLASIFGIELVEPEVQETSAPVSESVQLDLPLDNSPVHKPKSVKAPVSLPAPVVMPVSAPVSSLGKPAKIGGDSQKKKELPTKGQPMTKPPGGGLTVAQIFKRQKPKRKKKKSVKVWMIAKPPGGTLAVAKRAEIPKPTIRTKSSKKKPPGSDSK